MTKRVRLLLAAVSLLAALACLGLLLREVNRVERAVIDEQVGETHIYFAVDRQQVIWTGECVGPEWRVGPVQSVTLNDEGRIGEDTENYCVTDDSLPTLTVLLPDGTSRKFTHDINILFYTMKGWLLLAAPFVLTFVALHLVGTLRAIAARLNAWMREFHISRRSALLLISLIFLVWSAVFIYRSSTVLSDGSRYFSLFDDAMISMRYAWNLAHGYGLVWNPGEWVEGYTNLLMTLVMTLPNLLLEKRFAVLSVQILGVGFMLACAYITMRIGEYLVNPDTPYRKALSVLAFVSALIYYPLLYWSLMGMETGLLTTLLLLGMWCLLRFTHSNETTALQVLPVILGLAYLTRPDATIPIAIMLAYLTVHLHQTQPRAAALRASVQVGVVFALFPAAQLAFRLLYYGTWVPNTYTLKVESMPTLIALENGLNYSSAFLDSIAPVLIVALIGLLFRFDKLKLLMAAPLLGLTLYQTYIGGDAWTYWRVVAPGIPLLLALFFYELLTLAAYKAHLWNRALFRCGLIAVVVLALLGINRSFLAEFFFVKDAYQVDMNSKNIALAQMINDWTTPQASIGVIWAGTIPYYSDNRRAIDYLGKSDPVIARMPPDRATGAGGETSRPGHNKYDMYYSLQVLQPTVSTHCRWEDDNVCDWFYEHYAIAERDGLLLYFLRDSPDVRWELVHFRE